MGGGKDSVDARVVRRSPFLIRRESASGAILRLVRLVPVEQIKAPIRPESLLEFKLPDTQIRDSFANGIGRDGSRRMPLNRAR